MVVRVVEQRIAAVAVAEVKAPVELCSAAERLEVEVPVVEVSVWVQHWASWQLDELQVVPLLEPVSSIQPYERVKIAQG